jgi:hypothetical protein
MQIICGYGTRIEIFGDESEKMGAPSSEYDGNRQAIWGDDWIIGHISRAAHLSQVYPVCVSQAASSRS